MPLNEAELCLYQDLRTQIRQGLLAGLTPDQAQAVSHGAGPLLVVAGPGSGKTTVIVRRVAYLIALGEQDGPPPPALTGRDLTRLQEVVEGAPPRQVLQRIASFAALGGIDPSALLVVTFTKAAADLMKGRTAHLIGAAAASRATFGTFHGLAFRILRHAHPGQRFRILEEDQQLQLIRQLMRDAGLNTDDETVMNTLAEIARMRATPGGAEGFKPQAITITDFRQIWEGYQRAKAAQGMLDFDDLLHEALAELQGRPALLQAYRNHYRHVLVDEFQDTNAVQWELIRLLAEPRRNLTVVGDDDQAIYGWRGASPDFLLQFPQVYPDAVRVTLDLNHRCPPPVVEAANRLATCNRNRFGKVIRPAKRGGVEIELLEPADTLQEAEAVVRLVRASQAPLDHWAVIYRTNQQAHAIAQVMNRERIPYRPLGGLPNLYRRWPVQDVLAYLRAAIGEPFAIEPVLNRPTRYLSRAVLQEARRYADRTGVDLLTAIGQSEQLRSWQLRPMEELQDHLRALRRMTAPDAISYVRTVIGYDDYIREYAAKGGGSSDEMLGLLAEVERTSPSLMLTAFLAQVESFSAQSGQRPPAGEEAVSLVTCHRAKGLEFANVVVVGATDKLLPHRGSSDVEEERRLMYVAMTRAKERLWISAPRAFEGREAQPSPFIEEALGAGALAAD